MKYSILLLMIAVMIIPSRKSFAQNSDSLQTEYSKGAIQIGMVVSNMKKSLKFYKETLGLVETGGFSIEKDFAKKSGLSRGKPFEVTILKTQAEENASELKLLTFKGKATHPKQKNIQDDTGVQYITLYMKSLDGVIERLKDARVKLLGKTPFHFPDGRSFILVQDPDGTFVELIGPMTKEK